MGGLFWVLPGRGTARQGCWRNSRRGLPKKKTAVKANPRSASRLCYGSLRSPPRRREAEPSPQSVTHAVRTNCYLCGEELPSAALPIAPIGSGKWYKFPERTFSFCLLNSRFSPHREPYMKPLEPPD